MAVFSDFDLRDALENDEGIIISRRNETSITAVGYDLTIGFLCDADEGTETQIDPKTNRYCLLPWHRYLVISYEHLYLPGHCMATLHSRVSYVTKGLMVSSTTIDPNFDGFIYSVLTNCSPNRVYVKEHNAFLTMVIHKLLTPTPTLLRTNEDRRPRDGYSAATAPFSNLHPNAAVLAKAYVSDSIQQTKTEYQAALARYAQKLQQHQDALSHSQQMEELKAKLDAMQEQINQSRQKAARAKALRRRAIWILMVLLSAALFALLYSRWGVTFWSVLLPSLLALPSAVNAFLDLKKRCRRKK